MPLSDFFSSHTMCSVYAVNAVRLPQAAITMNVQHCLQLFSGATADTVLCSKHIRILENGTFSIIAILLHLHRKNGKCIKDFSNDTERRLISLHQPSYLILSMLRRENDQNSVPGNCHGTKCFIVCNIQTITYLHRVARWQQRDVQFNHQRGCCLDHYIITRHITTLPIHVASGPTPLPLRVWWSMRKNDWVIFPGWGSASSFLQCFKTVSWVTGRANLCLLSPEVIFWKRWRMRTKMVTAQDLIHQ